MREGKRRRIVELAAEKQRQKHSQQYNSSYIHFCTLLLFIATIPSPSTTQQTAASATSSAQTPPTTVVISSQAEPVAVVDNEFDKLMDRILEQIETRQQQQSQSGASQQQRAATGSGGQNSKVAADPNNRTTMRFFRNNKTFASIVYTNENSQLEQTHLMATKNYHDQQYQANNNYYNNLKKQPKRLINCHLVDLERHSPDVGVFENKYEIRTFDIDFKEMLQLIDHCTNIARMKPLALKSQSQFINNINNQLKPNVAQLFVPKQTDKALATGSSGHKHFGFSSSSLGSGSGFVGAFRPFVVVGRPIPHSKTGATHLSYASGPNFSHPQLKITQLEPGAQAQQVGAPGSNLAGSEAATYHAVMSGALNQELRALPAVVDDSNKLDLPTQEQANLVLPLKQQERAVQRRNHVGKRAAGLYSRRARFRKKSNNNNNNNHSNHYEANNNNNNSLKPFAPQAMAKSILQKAKETSQKLVLGEVTPAPSELESRQGGIKEAIQEITSYDTKDLLAIWRGILPGTNWCGMGDRATSYNDLGFESDIDICCRAHDFCPIRLSAFSGGYGLFNWSFYTRSHCWCDQNFLNCLQKAQSPLSSVVMKFYFTIMKTTCLHDNETVSALNEEQPFVHQLETTQLINNNNNYQQQFPLASAARQRFVSTNFGQQQQATSGLMNENLQQQQPFAIKHNNAAQQRLLLDQIRATMPIAALKQSQVVQSRIETNNNYNYKRAQQVS